jgi:hypothetical protein
MTIKIHSGFDTKTGKTVEAVVQELVKAHARDVSAGITSLTDSSAGVAGTALTSLSTSLANVAASGTSLASKATTEAALVTVVDAVRELYVKANEYATKVGIDNVTYSGGGVATDGTIAAVTVSTTGATTGAQATNVNAIFTAYNQAFYILGAHVNKLRRSQGLSEITLVSNTWAATVAAFATSAGTAADPGITKVAMDAELVKAANNIATLASYINGLNDGLGNALVVIV